MTSEGVVHGRGMVAAAAIAAEEVLFEIPRPALLSAKTSAFGDDDGQYRSPCACSCKQPRLSPFTSLTSPPTHPDGAVEDAEAAAFGWAPLLFAMMAERERGAASPWAPYYGVLPQPEELGHPHFWPAEETQALLGQTRLVQAVETDRASMREQFDAYYDHFTRRHPGVVSGSKGEEGRRGKKQRGLAASSASSALHVVAQVDVAIFATRRAV